MSSFWSTIIGAVAAIIGGLGAALWQTRRADDIARRIRREERREQALLALSSKVHEVHNRLVATQSNVELRSPTTQYHAANQALGELFGPWMTNWSAVITDESIDGSVAALFAKDAELLPPGDQAMQNPETEPAARVEHTFNDLQELIELTETLRRKVFDALVELNLRK